MVQSYSPDGANVPSSLCLSVGLSVTLVSPAQAAGPIKMPFELWTPVDPVNHVLDGGPEPTMGRGNFDGGRGTTL